MRQWLPDPITPATLRHSLNWVWLFPAVPALMMEVQEQSAGRSVRVALFALSIAAPLAAAQLIETEHDGRLDQMRLSGQRVHEIAKRLCATSVAALAIGAAALTWALASGVSMNSLLIVLTMAGITTAIAAIAGTATAARGPIDPRISIAGLGVMVLASTVIGVALLRRAPPAGYFAATLAVSIIITVARVRHVPARLVHAPAASRRRAATFRPAPHPWLLRFPAFYRGMCLSSSGLVLFAVFAPVLIPFWWFATEENRVDASGLALPPLVIGAIAVTLICREDAMCGRIELMRQSGRSAWRSALELIAGVWTPFIAVSVGVAMLASLLRLPKPTNVLGVAVVFAVLAPLPALEGWSRLWPMMLTIPFVVVYVTGRLFGVPYTALVLAPLGWYAAIRLFENSHRPILTGRSAVVVTAALCSALFIAVPIEPETQAVWVAGMLFLMSHIIIDPHADRTARWGQTIIVMLSMLIGTGLHGSADVAVRAALLGGTVWFAAYRLRQILPDRPVTQAAIRIAVLLIVMQVEMDRLGPIGSWIDFQSPQDQLIAAIAVAVLCELGYRVSLVLNRRTAPPTLPA